LDVRIVAGTRVAILGFHGTAKSSLLNVLAGDLVTVGEVRISQNLRIGRYSFVEKPTWIYSS
jgi:ATPase subunit of ABC transporter with duplicated ATPase domains